MAISEGTDPDGKDTLVGVVQCLPYFARICIICCNSSFSAGKYWHYYSLLLKSYKMFDSTEQEDCIKVIFYADKMVALVVRRGRVHLVQTFLYQDTKDVAYHLLNCCHQLDLRQEAVSLLVGGLIDRQSSLSAELHKYFLHVSFEEIDESIKVTDELKELPLHYFSSILKMAVCA